MAEPGSYQQPDVTLLGQEHVRRYQETDGRSVTYGTTFPSSS